MVVLKKNLVRYEVTQGRGRRTMQPELHGEEPQMTGGHDMDSPSCVRRYPLVSRRICDPKHCGALQSNPGGKDSRDYTEDIPQHPHVTVTPSTSSPNTAETR